MFIDCKYKHLQNLTGTKVFNINKDCICMFIDCKYKHVKILHSTNILI